MSPPILTRGTPLRLSVNKSVDAACRARSILDLPPWKGSSSAIVWNVSMVICSKSVKSTNNVGASLNAIKPSLVSGEESAIFLDISFTKFLFLEKISSPILPEASTTNPTSRAPLQGTDTVESVGNNSHYISSKLYIVIAESKRVEWSRTGARGGPVG